MIAAPTASERERVVAAAWARYRAALDGRTGKDYEQAEEEAWDELQRDLGGGEPEPEQHV